MCRAIRPSAHLSRDPGALRWRSAGPKESKMIDLSWDFDQSAGEVLGEHLTVVLRLSRGDRIERVDIRLSRKE